MEVILLEKIRNLGDMGATVSVKAGFARNYLLPYRKAVTATEANREKFARMRVELEKHAAELLAKAEERAAEFANITVTVEAKATEDGRLFGSVGAIEIIEALKKQGLAISKHEISLSQGPFREIGEFTVPLLLHTDVASSIKLKVIPVG